jgi:hypothetical protein
LIFGILCSTDARTLTLDPYLNLPQFPELYAAVNAEDAINAALDLFYPTLPHYCFYRWGFFAPMELQKIVFSALILVV